MVMLDQYDADGNLTLRASPSISWTSYDNPSQIMSGKSTETFTYGPNLGGLCGWTRRRAVRQKPPYSSVGCSMSSPHVCGILPSGFRVKIQEYPFLEH